MPPPKSQEEQEIDKGIRLKAEKISSLQKTANTAAQLADWVDRGNLKFFVDEIIKPLEDEHIHAIKTAKWVAASVPQVANLQGMLVVLNQIKERVDHRIAEGRAAVDELRALQLDNPTP